MYEFYYDLYLNKVKNYIYMSERYNIFMVFHSIIENWIFIPMRNVLKKQIIL